MWVWIEPRWTNHLCCILVVVFVLFNALKSAEPQGCRDGLYGLDCSQNCSHRRCLNRTSECNITGHCGPEGCLPGWYANDCTRKCEENCTTCDQQTGVCTGCINGTDNIFERCEHLCEKNNCSMKESKICLSDIRRGSNCVIGYIGISCIGVCTSRDCTVCRESLCDLGARRTDPTCNHNCTSECLKLMCDQVKGPCIMGCPNGLYGASCTKVCRKSCRGGVCDEWTGQCIYGCEPGLTGQYCDIPCSSTCYNKECNQKTSVCVNGCDGGFYGAKCDETCSENCYNKQCDRNTSRCLQGCVSGWSGVTCSDAERTPVMALVIAVVVLSFIIIALLLMIWYLIRYIRRIQVKRRKSQFKTSLVAAEDIVEVLQRRKSEGDALEKDIISFQKKHQANTNSKDDVFTFDTDSPPQKRQKPNSKPHQIGTESSTIEMNYEGETGEMENKGKLNISYHNDEKDEEPAVSPDETYSHDNKEEQKTNDSLEDEPDEVMIESTRL